MLEVVDHVVAGGPLRQDVRTEDIKFSPSGGVLAVPATEGMVFLLAVDTEARPVRVTRRMELRSKSLALPHGVDFVGEDVIVVANRRGCVTFFPVPPIEAWPERAEVEPIHILRSRWFGSEGRLGRRGWLGRRPMTRMLRKRVVNCGPGSVRVRDGTMLVSCNAANTVTAHAIRLRNGTVATRRGRVLARDGIEIPDGVAVTRDGRWMAVSDHDHNRVLLYRTADRERVGTLRDEDLRHPHGLCFSGDGRALYVTDAGTPLLHVFAADGSWEVDAGRASNKFQAVDEDAFRRTQAENDELHRALEGGMKGIDVDPSGRLIATTCRHQVLRFFAPRAPAA